VREIVRYHGITATETAERVLGLQVGSVTAELAALLQSYPEQTLQHRAVHFVVYERGRKWLFEGEDRNRYFLWQCTPFYDADFLEYGMAVPDELKARARLYRAFQFRLNPLITRIPHSDYKIPIGSVAYGWKVQLMKWAHFLPVNTRRALRTCFGWFSTY